MGRFSNGRNKRGQRRIAAANKPPKPSQQGECQFDRLPAELVGVVLSFVPPTNLPSVLRVCHTWHAVLQSDEPLWRRWCAQHLPGRLVEAREQPTWRAHFRQCVEKYGVVVYNLGHAPVEMKFSGRQTLEDVVKQICSKERPALRGCEQRLHVHLKKDSDKDKDKEDGESSAWVMLTSATPLFVHGLRRAGQRMSCSRDWDLDLDFHNLDRHTDEELREACWSLGVSSDRNPDWSRAKLIRSLSGSTKPSQFESHYAGFYG